VAAGWPFEGNGDNGGDPNLKDAGGRLRIPGEKAGIGGDWWFAWDQRDPEWSYEGVRGLRCLTTVWLLAATNVWLETGMQTVGRTPYNVGITPSVVA
jgi:hypothetical protein